MVTVCLWGWANVGEDSDPWWPAVEPAHPKRHLVAALRDAWWWEPPGDQIRSPVETPCGVAIIRGPVCWHLWLTAEAVAYYDLGVYMENCEVEKNLYNLKLYNYLWSDFFVVCQICVDFQYSYTKFIDGNWINLVLISAAGCWKWHHYVIALWEYLTEWRE